MATLSFFIKNNKINVKILKKLKTHNVNIVLLQTFTFFVSKLRIFYKKILDTLGYVLDTLNDVTITLESVQI